MGSGAKGVLRAWRVGVICTQQSCRDLSKEKSGRLALVLEGALEPSLRAEGHGEHVRSSGWSEPRTLPQGPPRRVKAAGTLTCPQACVAMSGRSFGIEAGRAATSIARARVSGRVVLRAEGPTPAVRVRH